MLNGPRWGIIGDGQLARMLALDAYPLGIRPVVLTSDPDSPAGQVAPLQVAGKVNDPDDLRALLAEVDGAVIESEFVDCDALEATGMAAKVFPPVAAIRVLQDKLEQKKLLRTLGIPTAAFHDSSSQSAHDASALTGNGMKPVVLKFATLGYDGKGVLVLDGEGARDVARAAGFLDLAKGRGIRVFAEEKILFQKELAMIAARGRDGTIKTWPLVISEQSRGICEKVSGPATRLGVDPRYETMARTACEKIGAALGVVGVYAVEFFLARNSGAGAELLVNEIAPRVHNSGHYTQNADCVSQFQNHWRAVLGLPLGNTSTGPGFFAMQNLLGPAVAPGIMTPPDSRALTSVHWYGKKTSTPGRKLGHVNGYSPDFDARDEVLAALQESRRQFQGGKFRKDRDERE